MPDIPTRLLVISARVPEGEKCESCQFLHQSKTYEYECSLFGWDYVTREWPSSQEDPLGEPDLYRLPTCRARDGWVAYPTDSGVAELVEAAKVYAAADGALEDAKDSFGPGSVSYVTTRNAKIQARWALQDAARKVAKESNDVPRD